ncbi:TetR/AcrR family transcriptional regulator C-terminal domain-containing protein [Sorangium sp. So ce394]|uniref:TetR/AcrR family transcriptional regulator C-terminal domain-containing protein n=1 Tax=Sorangium sp. So ce394 TaxID=3133310 RepID=UPI003F5C62AD
MERTGAEPPYRRIAAELRRRIESGELRPGDRVPSTRELARAHRVATATAAHALKELADAGLVRGVARVGTVVAQVRQRAPREHELTRARIVEAAIAIADAEGFGALSLRGVAAKLGAPVMSLYRHVASKEELVSLMTDAAFGEAALPATVPLGWRAQLEASARVQWAAFRRHPWLARVINMTRPEPLPNAIAHAEWILRALDGHGLDAAERMKLHIILYGFLQGIATNLEAEVDATSATGMTDDEWMAGRVAQFHALAASGRYPAFARVLDAFAGTGGFSLDFDELFALGLRALLDGFARVIERAPKGARAR